ncbi:hypothetical protein Tsp_00007 [Trichinella spiralis]|uniref:hypothetical protein n=1 Tax=Trichinella spiralis TaxID=6334 RepID=UPI0001EFB870|nr:hypothetical protein Tsp_00007 [Trichinella spiralis]
MSNIETTLHGNVMQIKRPFETSLHTAFMHNDKEYHRKNNENTVRLGKDISCSLSAAAISISACLSRLQSDSSVSVPRFLNLDFSSSKFGGLIKIHKGVLFPQPDGPDTTTGLDDIAEQKS